MACKKCGPVVIGEIHGMDMNKDRYDITLIPVGNMSTNVGQMYVNRSQLEQYIENLHGIKFVAHKKTFKDDLPKGVFLYEEKIQDALKK